MSTAKEMRNTNLLPYVQHFWDASNHIDVPRLANAGQLKLSLDHANFVKPVNPGMELVLGEGNSNHWVRFCLTNPSNQSQELIVSAEPAVMVEVDFYPQKEGARAFQTGSGLPMSTRDLYSPEFHFSVFLQANETQQFYMRLRSRTNAYLLASVWDKKSYSIETVRSESIDGVLAGVLVGLILYTLLLYFSVRQSSSLLYILWSASMLILLASIDGRILQYLLPDNPKLAHTVTVLFYPLSLFLSGLFAQEFMRLRDYPRLYRLGQFIMAGFSVALIVAYNISYAVYINVCSLFGVTIVIYLGLIAFFYGVIFNRSTRAKHLLIAQLPLTSCVIDRGLFAIGLTSEQYLPYTPKVGLVAVMILLAYFIGLTIYRDKNEAQKNALEQLRIANELKSNYNTELEAEIKRNTADILDMNTDLALQAKQLTELDQAKSKFFANISHEFRTPLTLIKGPLTRLLEQGRNAGDSQTVTHTHDNLSVIEDSIRHSQSLQDLIDQLLTLSKFDANSLSLKAQNINISQAVREISTQFSSLADAKQIELVFQTSEPLLDVFVDHDKLRMMLNNLLSNAMKFTDQGGRIEVRVSATVGANSNHAEHATDEYVHIQVNDTGHGIPHDELDLVFDRYYQSDSSALAGSGRGTGIGLALVKELVGLHAGQVLVSSVHQSALSTENANHQTSGTRFSIYLPLGHAHFHANELLDSATALEPKVSAPLPSSSSSPLSDTPHNVNAQAATVLVVDDNHDMRTYIRSVLAPHYTVLEAVDGLDAEDVLNSNAVDLVVTDLMMPKRDGLELVKSLKANGEFAKIPVIMLTAKAGLDDRLKGLIAAVDDYLAKPFDARELTICVQNLLTKHAQFKAFYQSPTLSHENQSSDDQRSENQSSENQSSEEADHEYIMHIRAIIDQHLSDPEFGVESLASEMHISKSTLKRNLATRLNFTPAAFIRQCRLEKARQLSQTTSFKTIGELAYAVGFNQAGYFARLYQNAFNIAPLDNEQKNANENQE